ncbi:MAG: Uma2 family endonuclease [Actinomycetota bacterium]|nr:Uma2 family endonuclease [Actinomycetota bacterium]
MRAVMLEVPDSLLAERRRLGHDHFDEMWEGELHMVPAPGFRHQALESWLVETWAPVARHVGLQVTAETGLFDPAVPGNSSYRRPDVVVSRPEHISARGVEGRAELAVEIRSPGDETDAKVPFYERVGVAEMLIIDTDLSLRRWVRTEDRLVEVTSGADGWVGLDALGLGMALRGDSDHLVLATPSGEVPFPLAS